jgi:hypothetical protein
MPEEISDSLEMPVIVKIQEISHVSCRKEVIYHFDFPLNAAT